MIKFLLKQLLRLVYRVEVVGLENYYKAGERVLIISNHLSFLDPPLIAAFLPEKPMFAFNTFIAQSWYFKPLFSTRSFHEQ